MYSWIFLSRTSPSTRGRPLLFATITFGTSVVPIFTCSLYFLRSPLTVPSFSVGNFLENFRTVAAGPFSGAYCPLSNLSASVNFVYCPLLDEQASLTSDWTAWKSNSPSVVSCLSAMIRSIICFELNRMFSNSFIKSYHFFRQLNFLLKNIRKFVTGTMAKTSYDFF